MKMKKQIMAALLIMVVLPCNVFASELEPFELKIESPAAPDEDEEKTIDEFNGYKWGTKISDIKQAEISEDLEEGTDYAIADDYLLIGNQEIAGLTAFAVYSYNDDEVLSAGQYALREQHTELNNYYDDYIDLVQSFSSVYGEPEFTGYRWYDDTYKDDPSNWGLAISMGHVSFKTIWKDQSGNTLYILMNGAASQIITSINYESVDFALLSLPIDKFDGYKWGSPREDIAANEITSDMREHFDYINGDTAIYIYDDSVAGYNADITYRFDKFGKLNSGEYRLREKHNDKIEYYNDFCDLVELYTEKYGQPYYEKEDWENDWYKDEPSKWGLAISAGHLDITKEWKDSNGNYITMRLWGYDYNVVTSIDYDFSGFTFESNTDNTN